MSSSNERAFDPYSAEEPSSQVDNELVEQLQLELEEARRVIRAHENKILSLQGGWRSFWSNYDQFITYL